MAPLEAPDTGDFMSPQSNRANLAEIKINVPPHLLEDALEIFEAMGLKPGDGHRDAWIEGIMAIAEKHNKVLVNKKLRRRLAGEPLPDDHDD
ncbi:MAG: hypothetical protein AAFX78_03700 [Cyanobacteria bacterium J06638_20]